MGQGSVKIYYRTFCTLGPEDPGTTWTRGLIRVQGARVNNLKDVSVDIPKRRLPVFTGVSGKSSLVFGAIAAESQRLSAPPPSALHCLVQH